MKYIKCITFTWSGPYRVTDCMVSRAYRGTSGTPIGGSECQRKSEEWQEQTTRLWYWKASGLFMRGGGFNPLNEPTCRDGNDYPDTFIHDVFRHAAKFHGCAPTFHLIPLSTKSFSSICSIDRVFYALLFQFSFMDARASLGRSEGELAS
jgi:hypothetical protein